MRSNFTSYSGYTPSSSSVSSNLSSQPIGYRRTSLTPHDDNFRGLSTSSSFSSSRDYRSNLGQNSVSSRGYQLSSNSRSSDKPFSSRVSHDEETRGFLERYNGGGNGGLRKTSLGEQPTSQFLQQRRQQQQQLDQEVGYGRSPAFSSSPLSGSATSQSLSQRRQSLESFGLLRAASASSPFSGQTLQTSNNRSTFMNDAAAPPADNAQNEYLQRLLAAHSRVDDLLRSRGLNGEDERKYVRTWEEIPIIREERYRRLRTPSGSSDSGLSTDNDSDRSNAEAAPAPTEQTPPPPPSPTPSRNQVIHVAVEAESEPEEEEEEKQEEKETEISGSFCFERDEEEIQEVHTQPVKSKIWENVSATFSFPTRTKSTNVVLDGAKVKMKRKKKKDTADATLPAKNKTSVKLKLNAPLPKTAKSEPPAIPQLKKTIPSPVPAPAAPKPVIDAKVALKKVIAAPKITIEAAEKCIIQRRVVCKEQGFFLSARSDDGLMPKILKIKKNKYDEHVKVQQKTLLAKLKRKPVAIIPSTAEISIQHCSFYSKTEKDNFVEKNVRLNLRMTERAAKQCTATIVLPSPPKVAYAREDINLFARRKNSMERRKTQEVVRPKQIGKLSKSHTVELQKEEKEPRKVNRLTIPEYFVQSNAEAMKENLKDARDGLKRISIVGGFVVQPKENPASTTKLKAIVRSSKLDKLRSERNAKIEEEPYSDFCQIPNNHTRHNIPNINIIFDNQGENMQRPSTPTRRRGPPMKNHLNLHGSLALAAKPSGAAILNCGNLNNIMNNAKITNFTEMSDIDRILVERFKSRMHIPRPHAVIRAVSPMRNLCIEQSSNRPASPVGAHFLRRRTPRRRSPTPAREEVKIHLKRSVVISKAQARRHWLDFKVELKQVDFEKHRMRRKPRRKLVRWVPKWRRTCTDEEVEEVEEEEEEEDDEGTKNESGLENDQSSKSERSKTKSFTEDGESLTEGARAMAAAKRRHEEDQEAKLVDYEERRRTEREKEEEDLKKLKEKQERRRLEREQEEKEMEERRKDAEDRRRQEEDARKAKLEEDKKKKEEDKNKRNQLMGGGFPAATGGRNFTIPKKETSNDKFGNIVQAKQEMGMTKNQQEDAKRAFIATIQKGIPPASDISPSDLKQKIKELHQKICRLETQKYDLEKRHERQEYDLKELNARQRQVTRNSGQNAGAGAADAGNSRYPAKVQMLSKYDRQIDRRNFRERRSVFDRRNAHPCFPGVPPPAAIYEKVFPEVSEVVAEEEEEEEEEE